MARNPFPSETQERFIVRMPDGLRDRIAAAAKRNGRSMNSEIVSVLEQYYPHIADDPVIERVEGIMLALEPAEIDLNHVRAELAVLRDQIMELREYHALGQLSAKDEEAAVQLGGIDD